MFKKLLLISALLVSGGFSTANAIPVLSFNPSSTTAILGSQITVDVVVSNLEPHFVAGYDLTFTYDPGVLSFFDASFTDLDGLFVDTSVLGEITWNSTNSSLTDAELESSQGDSLSLASIVMNTVGLGSSALTFTYHDLTGANANSLHYVARDLLDITVTSNGGNGNVPEPATLLLLSLGALGMAGTKRRQA